MFATPWEFQCMSSLMFFKMLICNVDINWNNCLGIFSHFFYPLWESKAQHLEYSSIVSTDPRDKKASLYVCYFLYNLHFFPLIHMFFVNFWITFFSTFLYCQPSSIFKPVRSVMFSSNIFFCLVLQFPLMYHTLWKCYWSAYLSISPES